jgi:hypothetical protein
MMQNAKDTFYEMLRSRIAAANPERTIALRGVLRPGVLVEENELVSAVTIPDCFRLRWTDASVDAANALPIATMTCEIMYETAGTSGNGGLDRGRLLTEMDAELTAAVQACPQQTAKQNYSALASGGGATAMSTNIWWSDVVLGPLVVKADRIGRTAKVTVMCCEEAGEL